MDNHVNRGDSLLKDRFTSKACKKRYRNFTNLSFFFLFVVSEIVSQGQTDSRRSFTLQKNEERIKYNIYNLASVGHWGDFDERVEGDVYIGQLRQRLLHEVGQNAPQHRLVSNQHHVSLSANIALSVTHKLHSTILESSFLILKTLLSRTQLIYFLVFPSLAYSEV